MNTNHTSINKDISFHEAMFTEYTAGYLQNDAEHAFHLKYKHTQHVLQNARTIIRDETISGFIARAGELAALYHDIGRFPQFAQWGTFEDKVSVNHGILGVTEIKKHQLLSSEPQEVQKLCLSAVVLHNKHTLPKNITQDLYEVTYIVRDADKLDIIRVIGEQLAQPSHPKWLLRKKNEPLLWTQKVVSDILNNEIPSYADLEYINDFKLLILSWIQDIYFSSARRSFANSMYTKSIFQSIPKLPGLKPVLKKLSYMLQESL